MERQTTEIVRADADGIARAVDLLRAGAVVAVPTETVYGLAGDATNGAAVAAIYAAKGRPSFNPLIVHVSGLSMARGLVEVSDTALDLMARFWPGPLTVVLPLRAEAKVAGLVTAGLKTLALRCPDHAVTQAVIEGLGRPIAAPSANASGQLTPTSAAHVLASLDGRIPMILDGGRTRAGIESTIVGIDGERVRLLRPGAVPGESLGLPLESAGAGIESPGQMASHYAPRQPVLLDANGHENDAFVLGFGRIPGNLSLSPTGDLAEAAANLFEMLHRADASGALRIAVAPIPEVGLGVAINDRLRRAAAPKGERG